MSFPLCWTWLGLIREGGAATGPPCSATATSRAPRSFPSIAGSRAATTWPGWSNGRPLKLHDVRDDGRGEERQELYDIATDAGEQHNLIEAPPPAARDQLAAMIAALSEFGVGDAVAMAPSVSRIDAQTRERLRALGYGDGAASDARGRNSPYGGDGATGERP